jgi:hypothetical protein
VQHENMRENEEDEFAPADSGRLVPGRAHTPAPPRIDEDVETIRELLGQIELLRPNLTTHSRDDLAAPLALLRSAADRRDTDAKPVREALQQVLLTVGIGALATLSGPARRRLAALTGIALPGSRNPAGAPDGTVPEEAPGPPPPPSPAPVSPSPPRRSDAAAPRTG